MKFRTLLNDSLVWLFVCLNAIGIGSTVYQMMVLVPEWNRDIPNGMISFAHSEIVTANFWRAPFLGIMFGVCLLAPVLNWNTGRRKWLLLSFAFSIVGVVVTMAYFVPMLTIMGLIDHHPSADMTLLSKTIKTFTVADIVRFWILLVPGFLFSLKAITVPVDHQNELK